VCWEGARCPSTVGHARRDWSRARVDGWGPRDDRRPAPREGGAAEVRSRRRSRLTDTDTGGARAARRTHNRHTAPSSARATALGARPPVYARRRSHAQVRSESSLYHAPLTHTSQSRRRRARNEARRAVLCPSCGRHLRARDAARRAAFRRVGRGRAWSWSCRARTWGWSRPAQLETSATDAKS
jgi:hypothetical protein